MKYLIALTFIYSPLLYADSTESVFSLPTALKGQAQWRDEKWRIGGFYLPIEAGGTSLSCQLYTGSQMIKLPIFDGVEDIPEIVQEDGYTPFHLTLNEGVGQTSHKIIPELKVGALSFTNLEAYILKDLPGLERSQQCLLGLDFFNMKDVLFNFPNNEITINTSSTPKNLYTLDQFLLRVKSPRTGEVYTGKIDDFFVFKTGFRNSPYFFGLFETGAPITVVSESLVKRFPHKFRDLHQTINFSNGRGGHTPKKLFMMKNLRVGGKHIRRALVMVIEDERLFLTGALDQEGNEQNIEILIGYNIISRYQWWFSPTQRVWSVD